MRRTAMLVTVATTLVVLSATVVLAAGGLGGRHGPQTVPPAAEQGAQQAKRAAPAATGRRRARGTRRSWKANAVPAWSSRVGGFQVAFARRGHGLGIVTPDWVSLRCASPKGRGRRHLIGGFGLHLSKRPAARARYRGRKIRGGYATRRRADVLRTRYPGVPTASRVRVAFRLVRSSVS